MQDQDLEIGQTGYLVGDDCIMHVEFVGFDSFEPDYPSKRTRYYRALEQTETRLSVIYVGEIIERYGRHDEYLYPDRAPAEAALEKEQLDELERKRKELAELEARAFRSKGDA